MDVVDAINAWIDDQLTDLGDNDLRETLEVLDVIAASDIGSMSAANFDDIDVGDVFDLFEDERQASFAEWVVLEALIRRGEASDSDEFGDLGATRTTEHAESAPKLEFGLVADGLGPSFLADAAPRARGSVSVSRRSYVVALMILGIAAAFLFGLFRLIASVETEPAEVGSAQAQNTPPDSASPDPPTTAPTADDAPPPATDDPIVDATDDSQAGQEALSSFAVVRLASGDVVLADLGDDVGVPKTVYDASDSQRSPATNIESLGNSLGIISESGEIHTVDLARENTLEVVWDAASGLPAATAAARVLERIAVLTSDGSILLFPRDEAADPEAVDIAWDPAEGEARAIDLSSIVDLMPFVLETGDAQMLVASADDAVVGIWSSELQPPAFRVTGNAEGILMGVGQGAVARYRLGDFEGPPLEAVWDPSEAERLPAIGFAQAGESVAIVLQDGSVVLADSAGVGTTLWDPATTEILAIGVAATAEHIIVLLEVGSVVRIPFDGDNTKIDVVWDITDETLAKAAEILVMVSPS